MLFRRKIYDKFLTWKKETGGKKALLVEGARRIGRAFLPPVSFFHVRNLS